MTVSDIVSMLDRKFYQDPIQCPKEGTEVRSQTGRVFTEHGNLTVHGSGAYIVCGRCGYNQPVGRP